LKSTLSARVAFVWRHVERYRTAFLAGIVAMLARDGIAATIPLLIRKAITLFSASGATGRAVWIASAIVAAATCKAGLQAFARLKMMNVSRDAEYEVRNDLFRHLMSLEPGFYSRMRTGDIMALATNDLNAVKLMLGPGLVNLSGTLVTFPIAVAVMGYTDWRLALLALSPLPIAAMQMAWFGRREHDGFEGVQGLFSKLSAAVQQHTAGVRSVRAFAQEAAEVRRFGRLNHDYFQANRKLDLYTSLNDPLLNFMVGLATLGILWYGGCEVLASRLSLGNFVMFLTYMGTLQRPVAGVGVVMEFMPRGLASVGRLEELFSVKPAIAAPRPVRAFSETPSGRILFDQISVQYGTVGALRNLDLTVPAGTHLAIVGATGSGKSTLARLIPRLIDPTAGRVTVDGVDVRDLAPEELRAHIGFVPQDTFLFSATLAENIAWGAPHATAAEVRHAAEVAGLEQDIASFPQGYETVVGERGVLLSGGQKQRVAIARAIIKRPRILIFDDSLSSVDSVTEQRILDHLDIFLDGCTTILITHRLSSIRQRDHVVVLERGSVAEEGSRDELLGRGGRLARLWRQHQLEEALETA
jgi:ATP-binding cassette, subfamily B, multidrug efflux pump